MRRILGAALLFAVVVLPRTVGLIRSGLSDSWPPEYAAGARMKAPDAPRARPGKSGSDHVSKAPARYLSNPLEFLSTAPVDSLVLLPGIGPVIAERIADARTGKRSFTSWEDLMAVRGIGPKKLDRLKRLAHGANRP